MGEKDIERIALHLESISLPDSKKTSKFNYVLGGYGILGEF